MIRFLRHNRQCYVSSDFQRFILLCQRTSHLIIPVSEGTTTSEHVIQLIFLLANYPFVQPFFLAAAKNNQTIGF